MKKPKSHYLYLPLWVIALIAVICIVAGILVGSGINKSDNHAKNGHNAVTDSSESISNPKADKTQWNLILVNQYNKISDDYGPEVTYLDNGHAIDKRAYPDLADMLSDCREAGLTPVICSSYRSMDKQKELFKNKVDEYISFGCSKEEAEQKAGELVAVPGTSEHQLGLALDIVDISYQVLDEKQEKTGVQKWLMHNSWKYGFILRYPTDKNKITGISYEPWHYRYVGKKAAKEIYDAQICLEEYLNG